MDQLDEQTKNMNFLKKESFFFLSDGWFIQLINDIILYLIQSVIPMNLNHDSDDNKTIVFWFGLRNVPIFTVVEHHMSLQKT